MDEATEEVQAFVDLMQKYNHHYFVAGIIVGGFAAVGGYAVGVGAEKMYNNVKSRFARGSKKQHPTHLTLVK